MQSQLNKALKLAKKTGDRLIVFESPESEDAFVVMNLDQYEYLLEGDCAGCCEDDDCCEDECECDCGHDHGHEEEFQPEVNIESDLEDEMMEPEDFDYASEVRSLTEEELLDKINRDIALWKESQKEADDEESSAEKLEKNQTAGSETEERNKSKWAIKNEIKENADEIIEEDRHYLEEVKY